MKAQNKEEIRKKVAARKRINRKAERKQFGSTIRVTLKTA
jgi:hypothetical protein